MVEEKYLVMITGQNNNKFYHMIPNGSTLIVEYGRIGASKQTKTYSISSFNSKYNEKINKGYSDKTELFLVPNDNSQVKQIEDNKIRQFFEKLLKFSNDSVLKNYTVNVGSVTQAQIDEAQNIINNLSSMQHQSSDRINKELLNLYHTIPRKMNNVKNYLIDDSNTNNIKDIIIKEQDLLDSLQSSVSCVQQDNTGDKTILEMLDIEVNHCNDTQINQIKSHMGSSNDRFVQAYVVKHNKHNDIFEQHNVGKDKKFFWHGTRNENVISILQKSLQIRPSGAVITGSMFGCGIYFADKFMKSLGYTSVTGSYWARGNSGCGYLLIFEVAVGNQKHIHKHDSSCYSLNEDKITKEGYDSVYAHGGADLRNDEFIIYNTNKCRIRYIVEVK